MNTKRSASQRWAAACGVLVLVIVLFAGHCESGKGILIQNIYVTQGLNGDDSGNIEVYPLTATGNIAPATTIAGESTDIEDAHKCAFDASGNIYVTSKTNSSVLVFAAGASGDVAPISTISGSNTGLVQPTGIAVDSTGKIYVADYGAEDPGGPSVFIFAAGANGNVAPVATITGAATGLVFPNGLALDSSGKIYVANEGTNQATSSVTVYAAGATGNAAPLATISGSATLLNDPHGLALDAAGNIYVANLPPPAGAPAGAAGPGPSGSVLVFAAGSTGNVAPKTTITGSSTLLSRPNGISLDALGNIYVADNSANAVLVFTAGATGNVAPISNISGANTGFSDLHGVTVF